MKHLWMALALAVAIQDPDPWRLIFEQGGKIASVRGDGTDRREESGASRKGGAVSPDGTRLAYTDFADGDSEIWVSDADGGNARRLTDNRAVDAYPSWTPDGKRLTFSSTRDGKSQIWIMQADGSKPVRLTTHEHGAREARVSPAGDRIAYLELHPARDKVPPSTLRTMDLAGGESHALIEKSHFIEHAWSPKGDLMACSLIGDLRIVEMATGKVVKTVAIDSIHKDLYAHAAGDMVWTPDGDAIACTIRFLGGRHGDVKIFGDDQLFILPMKGKPAIVEAGGPAKPMRWIR